MDDPTRPAGSSRKIGMHPLSLRLKNYFFSSAAFQPPARIKFVDLQWIAATTQRHPLPDKIIMFQPTIAFLTQAR